MSIGFHHSKLLYSLDEKATEAKLLKALDHIGKNKDLIFVEAGKDIFYGTSVYLDAISLAKIVEGQLLIMVSGDEDTIIDDMSFLTKYIRMDGFHFMGLSLIKSPRLMILTISICPEFVRWAFRCWASSLLFLS